MKSTNNARLSVAIMNLAGAVSRLEQIVDDEEQGPLPGVINASDMERIEAIRKRLNELCGDVAEEDLGPDPLGDWHGRNE